VNVERSGTARLKRVIPGPCREQNYSTQDRITQHGACETTASIVEHSDDVAVRDVAGGSIILVDRDWFAALDLSLTTDDAVVILAVQSRPRLI